jgi:cytochrome oxidase Cu insertion factor (SCO1/SenC/PrrC family)
MSIKIKIMGVLVILVCTIFLLTACVASKEPVEEKATSGPPEWFGYELVDVKTGDTFTMNDYAGKVVLLETMAIWCPNCIFQGAEIRKLHELLGNSGDLISISLDVDVNEDAASLKEYTEEFGFDWHFAISPTPVNRALGNLYTAQYLNPPLSPMLVIDRDGEVHHLPYGKKDAQDLLEFVEPFLNR